MSPRLGSMPFETAGGLYYTQFGDFSDLLLSNQIGISENSLKGKRLKPYTPIILKAEKWSSAKFDSLLSQYPFVLVPMKDSELPYHLRQGLAVLPRPDSTMPSYAQYLYLLKTGDWLKLNPNLAELQKVSKEKLRGAITKVKQQRDPAFA